MDGETFYKSYYKPVLLRALLTEACTMGDDSLMWEEGKLRFWYVTLDADKVPRIRYAELVPANIDTRQIWIDREITSGYLHSDPICGEYEVMKLYWYASKPGTFYVYIWDEGNQDWILWSYYSYTDVGKLAGVKITPHSRMIKVVFKPGSYPATVTAWVAAY